MVAGTCNSYNPSYGGGIGRRIEVQGWSQKEIAKAKKGWECGGSNSREPAKQARATEFKS
jgi:hypothetical protein